MAKECSIRFRCGEFECKVDTFVILSRSCPKYSWFWEAPHYWNSLTVSHQHGAILTIMTSSFHNFLFVFQIPHFSLPGYTLNRFPTYPNLTSPLISPSLSLTTDSIISSSLFATLYWWGVTHSDESVNKTHKWHFSRCSHFQDTALL